MAKTRLMQAVCTAAILAAVPALAQSNNPPGQTGSSATGMPQTPSGQAATPGATVPATPNNYGSMSQNGATTPTNQGMDNENGARSSMHRSAMGTHSQRMMHSRRQGASQNTAVDQLNDESLRAARQGQAFNGTTGAGMSGGSGGGMNDMSGGSNSGMGGPGGASSDNGTAPAASSGTGR